jgi:pimeloyl-ACP methyl ester carboxylesterase
VASIGTRFVDLPNGQRLHVAMAGSGRPILFLHGFPEFWFMWESALRHFGGTHCAIAPDQRGYNLSSKPSAVRDYRAKPLVENSWRDDFWGWGPNRDGQNMLGRLWMEVRAALRDEEADARNEELAARTA